MKTNEKMYKKYQFQISYHDSLTYCFVVDLHILTLHLHLRGVSQNYQPRRVSLRLICTLRNEMKLIALAKFKTYKHISSNFFLRCIVLRYSSFVYIVKTLGFGNRIIV